MSKIKKLDEKNKDASKKIWIIKVFIISFFLSIIFSWISTNSISDLGIIEAIFVLILIIFVGIIFDIIGVSINVAKESDFHAKATRKIKGARTSIKLIRNAPKVSSICADVIGDIAGVLSGAISALVVAKVSSQVDLGNNLQFIISAMVASLTIGGKAIGKNIAIKCSTPIILMVGKVLNIFDKKK